MSQTLKEAGGIILAGGRSTRMGRNKALLRLEKDGPTLIEMVVAALRAVVNEITIVTNSPAIYQGLGLKLITDKYLEAGPLAGIEAGLASSQLDYNLVVACDMPYLQPLLLQHLLRIAQAEPETLAVIPTNIEGKPEPLCAVYSKRALPAIQKRLQLGQYKLMGLADEIKVTHVTAPQLQVFDPTLCSFLNLNTPNNLPPDALTL